MKKINLIIPVLLFSLLCACSAPIEEAVSTPPEVFTQIADNSVFHVNWHAVDGDFKSGTSSCIQTDLREEPILITAFHYFGPETEDEFLGEDLEDYVLGGDLSDILTDVPNGAVIRDVIPLVDAAPVPQVNRDLAAFYLSSAEGIKPFSLASEPCKKGDTIYLLASLWDTDAANENCIYPATVIDEKDGVVYYSLDEKYGTTGASGAPIVNGKGEVVAIHIASNGSTRVGHAANSIYEMLKKAI